MRKNIKNNMTDEKIEHEANQGGNMIRICIPFYQNFDEVKKLLVQFIERGKAIDIDKFEYKGYIFHIVARQGTCIHEARNHMITDGTENVLNYSHFMLLDSDISGDIDDIVKLIKHDKDIVGGKYLHHKKTHYNIWELDEHGHITNYLDKTGLHKVGGVATGFVLIKKRVFENIPESPEWFYQPKINGKVLSLDINFCRLAGKHGFDVWCDFDIKLNHKIRSKTDFNWSVSTKEDNVNTEKKEDSIEQPTLTKHNLYNVKLPEHLWLTVVTGLKELKFKVAEPVLSLISAQIKSQRKEE